MSETKQSTCYKCGITLPSPWHYCPKGQHGDPCEASPKPADIVYEHIPECGWSTMDTAPRDGSVFLLSTYEGVAIPAFRRLEECNEEGHCADGEHWVLIYGSPTDGGGGVNTLDCPDSLVGERWRWKSLPNLKG